MKSIRLLLALLSPMILFFSCAKEKSVEAGSGSSTSAWEFTQGSTNYHGKIDTAYKAEVGAGVNALLIEGTSDDGTGVITLGIIGLTSSGTGVYKSPNVLFDYSKAAGTVYQNDITAVDKFVIEITKMDASTVTGVFSGEVKDSTGAIKNITNGKFTARFGSSTNNPGANGQITVWSKSGCGTGTGPVKILLNNQTGTITSFNAAEPACGAAGTATFNVPAGTYAIRAVCGTDTTAPGIVTVASSQCVKVEITFNNPPPVSNGSWSFRDSASHKTYSGVWDGPGYFGNDLFGNGNKALYLTGSINGSDTLTDLYVNFPASATQPLPGTYTTTPDFSNKTNNTDWDLYDDVSGDYLYFVREIFQSPPPAGLQLTIIITSYDPTTKVVKGTFSGKALNGAGVLVDINNGKFEATVQL